MHHTIVQSLPRSSLLRTPLFGVDPTYDPDLEHGSLLELAPGFFYDEAGAGTNGIGSALAAGQPVVVEVGEHFADALTGRHGRDAQLDPRAPTGSALVKGSTTPRR